jgi:hypothetical protein
VVDRSVSSKRRAGARHILGFATRFDRERALSEWGLYEFLTVEGPEVRSVPPGWTPNQPEPPVDWAVTTAVKGFRGFGRKLEESR